MAVEEKKATKTAQCFVIGPIGSEGSDIRAAADDFMDFIVNPVVTSAEFGYTPIRADGLNEPGRITSQIIKLLLEADLVIADLTTNNANVFYELSLRHAIGKPVVHMAHDDTRLSFDVQDNRTIFYTMHSRMAQDAKELLARQIRHVRQPGYKAMNPILETMAILNLKGSDVPEQKAIGQVMERLEQLGLAVSDIQQQMRTRAAPRNNVLGLLNTPDVDNARLRGATSASALSRALAYDNDGNYNALRGLLHNEPPNALTQPSDTKKK